MKKVTASILFMVLLCNTYAQFVLPQEEESGALNCTAFKPEANVNPALFQQKFIPNDTTPIVTIKIDFHIWRTDSGTGNVWLDLPEYRDTLRQVVNILNDIYSNNTSYCLNIPNAQFILDTKVRFEIDTFYYYENTYVAMTQPNEYYTPATWVRQFRPDRIKNYMCHLVIRHPDSTVMSGTSSGYDSDMQYVTLFCQNPTQNPLHKKTYIIGQTMAHEFGHNFALKHPYFTTNSTSEERLISHSEFLWDVFGLQTQSWCNESPEKVCHHTLEWNCQSCGSTTIQNCTNNIMGSASSARHFSALQMGRIRRTLTVSPIRNYAYGYHQIPKVVFTNETWDCKYKLYQDLVIAPGATLTVLCDVEFVSQAKVIIQPGGKLVVNGGKLTKAKNEGMWQGIIVMGNSSQPISQTHQGYLQILNNGTIENAMCGVTVNGGGIVNANSAKFINNKTGVKFGQISSSQSGGTSGTFTNTDFTLNNSYLGATSSFEAHLKMDSCGQVSVTGCTFSSHVLLNSNNGIVVSNSSTNWSEMNKLISVPLAIRAGATLTNTGTVSSNQNTVINIYPKGRLVIDDGIFNNNSAGIVWQGITVMGDPTQPLSSSLQGHVKLENNAKIENATIGIYAVNGGTIYTNNAHFINNTIAVQIEPVTTSQTGGYSAIFFNTQFVIDNAYLGNTLDFGAHLKLSGCGKVTVQGCKFFNNATNKSYDAGKNTGIWAFNTPLYIHRITQNPVFSGFNVAIAASNSGASPSVFISRGDFSNNLYGIKLNAVNYADITRNEFEQSLPEACGLAISNSTGYLITENEFSSPNASLQTTGMFIEKSGSAENMIYKNDFQNLNIGIQAIDQNSSQFYNPFGIAVWPVTGLQFLCNHFYQTTHADILVGYSSILQPSLDNSVRGDHGNLLQSAGNTFSTQSLQNQVINFNNHSNYHINYYYNGVPPLIWGLVTNLSSTYAHGCLSILDQGGGGGGDLDDALAQYDEWNEEYNYWLAKLLAFEGGEDDEEYNFLLNMTSHFSALKDNYFNSIIVAALNKEEEKEEGRKGEIENPQSKFEKLRFLFEYRNHYTDNLSITETYLAENNYEEALATLANMYNQFEVAEEQVMELNGLEIYAHWLQQLENEEKSIYALSERELDYLVNYVKINTGRGKVFANNILCALYNICIEDEVGGEQYTVSGNDDEMINPRESVSSASSACSKNLENITLYPNPTTGELEIRNYELRINSIEVFDVYGRIVSSHHLPPHTSNIPPSPSSSHQKINISHINSGIYFVKITTDSGEVVKKVVKQ